MAEGNDAVIERFYDAFARHDGETMAACYASNASFSDPVFSNLRRDEPGAMWRMLTQAGGDLEVQLVEHSADGETGSAHWLADYTFSDTGRRVHNDVHASFLFQDGLILQHRDEFDFHAWARQALGATGLLLGWTPIVHGAVKKKARARLDEFLAGDAATRG